MPGEYRAEPRLGQPPPEDLVGVLGAFPRSQEGNAEGGMQHDQWDAHGVARRAANVTVPADPPPFRQSRHAAIGIFRHQVERRSNSLRQMRWHDNVPRQAPAR